MRAYRITASFFLVLLACGPALAQGPARSQLFTEGFLNRYGLTRSWWSHATINPQRDKLLYMVVDETHIFLQASSGAISAFDAETGKALWTKQIGPTDTSVFPATSNDELLFVVNGLRLYALNKDTGTTVWTLGMPGMPAASPSADTHRVYVGFIDGSLYAFDLKITRELFNQNKLPQFSESAVLWRYRTSKAVSIPAVPGENIVAFASRNGSLYSVTTDDRKLVFQFETDAPLTAPIVRYRNTLLLASEDYNFYSLNLRNGKPGWQFTAGAVIRKAPVLIDDEVYLFPERANMFKLSAATGEPQWSVPRMVDFLAASTNQVYVVDKHNNFTVLSRRDGQPLGMFPLGQFTKHLANDRSDRIYVATAAGLVICLHEQGREFARFHMHPDRQPILPEFAPEGAGDEGAAEDGAGMEGKDGMPDAEMPGHEGDKPEAEADDGEKPEAEDAEKPDEEAEAEKSE
jgi:outer membrane protein assembly factor BamB